MMVYGRRVGIMSHVSNSLDESMRLVREALEKAEAERKAREESFRKAIEKINDVTSAHYVLDEAGMINAVVVHGGGSVDITPDGKRVVTHFSFNSTSSRKPPKKRSKSSSDHEPYYVKLTQKKRR